VGVNWGISCIARPISPGMCEVVSGQWSVDGLN